MSLARTILLSVVLVANSAVVKNGPATAGAAPAMFRGDPALTGATNAPPPRSLVGVRFRFRADGPIRSTPAFAGGKLFFGSNDGHLYAINARTGAVAWRFVVGVPVTSSPSVVANVAYFTAFDGALYAVNAATGQLRWKRAFGADLGTVNYWDFYTSSPTPFAGALYVGSGDGHVYAVDQATGRVRWSYNVGSRVRGTPAVTATTVVVGTMAGHVVAIDRVTGVKRWDFATDGAGYTFERKKNDTTSVFATPAIGNGVVAVGARDGNLYGIDLATGALRWKSTHDGESWILSTGIQGDTVFSGSGSALFIQSASLADGKEKWRSPTAGAMFGPVAIAGDTLVVADLSGRVRAVDTATGRERWTFGLADRTFSGVLIADGAVFAAADDGTLVALDTSTVAANNPTPKQLVYHPPQRKADLPEYLSNGAGLTGDFVNAGYTQVDRDALVAAMNDQINGRADAVIVFVDPNLPAVAFDPGGGAPMLRRFLDAGGTAIFLGYNPLAFRFKEDGTLGSIDDQVGATPLDMKALPRPLDFGYIVSTYTPTGMRWGLAGSYVTNGAMTPDQVSIVLGKDRLGNATSWAKRYGTNGLLVQLPVPRNRMIDMTPLRNAIDHAVARRP